jgi:Protein of unknown function (DUF4230)
MSRKLIGILSISLILLLASCQKNKRHFVISKIKSTAKLATTETIIDKVVIGQKERKMFGLVHLNTAEFVAYTKARVKTGIDLTKIKKGDVEIKGSMIELNLPPIEVLDFKYSFEDYIIDKQLSDNDFLNKIDVIDQEEFFRKAEIDIRKHLKYMGIKEQTQTNTRKLMESLLSNLGYKEIYIVFADSTELIQQVKPNNTTE